MKEELEAALFNDFPRLYERGLDYGFECGDGWYSLIRRLSEKLTGEPQIRAGQVKSKFGQLRFYIDPISACTDAQWDAINHLIAHAETESRHTCQACGTDGETGRDGCCALCWIVRLQTPWKERSR